MFKNSSFSCTMEKNSTCSSLVVGFTKHLAFPFDVISVWLKFCLHLEWFKWGGKITLPETHCTCPWVNLGKFQTIIFFFSSLAYSDHLPGMWERPFLLTLSQGGSLFLVLSSARAPAAPCAQCCTNVSEHRACTELPAFSKSEKGDRIVPALQLWV